MSHPVRDRLHELAAEVRDLEVMPAAAVRARGRRRGRRQATALAAAVVAATAGVALAWPQQRTVQTAADPAIGPAVTCVLTLPASPAEVRIRVLDGGAPAGLREATVAQLRARSFGVVTGPTGDGPAGAAALRYGPAAIGAATMLRAGLTGEVTMRFDPGRRDETIDLTLGPAFTRLATTTEMNRNLVAVGEPSAPPQCSTTAAGTPGPR